MADAVAESSHGHDKHVFHHFVDAHQQFDASKMGMWIFLATEILFFGGLFAAYIIFRSWYPQTFVEASDSLNRAIGGINTVVLIISSLTMALAIHYIQRNDKGKTILFLGCTWVLAATFMVIKGFEWSEHFSEGMYAGKAYAYTGVTASHAYIFYSLYYLMTGLHGIHVLVGMGLITWLMIKTKRGQFSSDYFTPVEITGLYWHLVDIIWIFLLPLFYIVA